MTAKDRMREWRRANPDAVRAQRERRKARRAAELAEAIANLARRRGVSP